jgi:hypothetical protein
MPTQIFNVADYRRKNCGALKDAEWFDSNNKEAYALRTLCHNEALTDMKNFFDTTPSCIGIFDASNPTHSKRHMIREMVRKIQETLLSCNVNDMID